MLFRLGIRDVYTFECIWLKGCKFFELDLKKKVLSVFLIDKYYKRVSCFYYNE